VAQAIRPSLEAGKIVICDRFYDSTFAYQGYGHGLDQNVLRQITEFATGNLKPDLTIYIDVNPEEGLRRRSSDQNAEWNRLDALAMEFHRRVYEGYQVLIRNEPSRWVSIDGSRSIEIIQTDIQAVVLTRLKR
jgi:dTMP kinase